MGIPSGQDQEADGLLDRRHLRWHVGRLPGLVCCTTVNVRSVPVLLLDPSCSAWFIVGGLGSDLGRRGRRAACCRYINYYWIDPRCAQAALPGTFGRWTSVVDRASRSAIFGLAARAGHGAASAGADPGEKTQAEAPRATPKAKIAATRHSRTGRARRRPRRSRSRPARPLLEAVTDDQASSAALIAVSDVSLRRFPSASASSRFIGPNGAGKSTLFNMLWGF